jgi:hypothetical protein
LTLRIHGPLGVGKRRWYASRKKRQSQNLFE